MAASLYQNIAKNNVKKNTRFYLPGILTEAGLVACLYILLALGLEPKIKGMLGGEFLRTFVLLGAFIMGILSLVLLLYTSSFLMKQRMKEYGLYYALGMEKKHVSKVLFHEKAISSAGGILLGIGGGLLFFRLCILILAKMMGASVIPKIQLISLKALVLTILFFAVADMLTWMLNQRKLSRMKTTELLHSDAAGEKEPKTRYIPLVVGAASMAVGYYIALTTQKPLEALKMFFIAVFLVILGTYLLFGAGSIFVLKRLRANEKFYYQKNHMTAVSGLLYRMKKNAVGLASIAILSTCILVLVSTSVSLYSGMKETVDSRYPNQLYVTTRMIDSSDREVKLPKEALTRAIHDASIKSGLALDTVSEIEALGGVVLPKDGKWTSDFNPNRPGMDLTQCYSVEMITEKTYRELGGKKLGLKGNEAVLSATRTEPDYGMKKIHLGKENLTVKNWTDFFPVKEDGASLSNMKRYGIIVADGSIMTRLEQQYKTFGISNRLAVTFQDRNKAYRYGSEFSKTFQNRARAILAADYGIKGSSGHPIVVETDSAWDAMAALTSMYGSFLFVGGLLGIVFMFATVLIIYYKQIAEGYEDRKRFQIMEKVGMSSDEVKKAIHTQIRMVFFLPVVVAGIHTVVAFPILVKLLQILLLSKTSLFALSGLFVYGIYVLIYTTIYRLTSRTYYRIVR